MRGNLGSVWSAAWRFCTVMRRALNLSFCDCRNARDSGPDPVIGSNDLHRIKSARKDRRTPKASPLPATLSVVSALRKIQCQLTHFAEIQFACAQIGKRFDVEKLVWPRLP